MCRFLSVVILRNGDVLHHPLLDSHSDLVTYFKLPDDSAYAQHFAKAELTPTDDASWTDASKWEWRIDEPTKPGWLSDVEGQAEASARAVAQRMVLPAGEHQMILDGCHIVSEGVTVRDFRGGRIVRVCGGTVFAIRGGTVPAAVGEHVALGRQATEYYERLKVQSQAAKKKPRATKNGAK